VKKVSLEKFRKMCENCEYLSSYFLFRDSANVECKGYDKVAEK